jgi:hypothetical protein
MAFITDADATGEIEIRIYAVFGVLVWMMRQECFL